MEPLKPFNQNLRYNMFSVKYFGHEREFKWLGQINYEYPSRGENPMDTVIHLKNFIC